MNQYFSILLAGILIQSSTVLIASGQEKQFTKTFHQEYKPDVKDVLRVENIYGTITVNSWNQNRVVIDVKVVYETSSQEKAERVLGYVTVDFAYRNNEIERLHSRKIYRNPTVP